jgi:crotonobetainyl-CoA:carnitine CoA-transferase CaiB-like acyl-CoA transferase
MPTPTGLAIGDISAGLFSAFGLLSALFARERTGVGQRVETSILDVLLAFQSYRVPQVFGAGMKFGPHPRRSGAGQVPYGAFPTKGGAWITIAAGPPQFWEGLCRAIGREDLKTDPRFSTLEKRRENEDELSEILEQALKTRTASEWGPILLEAGIPNGKVNDIESAFTQPQAQARNMLISFDHPLGKKMKCAGSALKFSATSIEEYKAAPGIGEHTQEILSELLGYSSEKIARLREERVVWYPYQGVFFGSGPMARF